MGERKVLNKYFPPDFDPSKIPKAKRVRSEDKQMKVRMMLPMTVRCNVCGVFMYKGTKFNTRMEDVRGEDYLGIKIFRFYYRCTHCSAEFCMKTDPKNADYQLEAGATRNYEPWREREKAATQAVVSREDEERGNAMKALENRALDSKREMDILSALDEMRSLKARHEQVDTEAALAALKRSSHQEAADLDAEDEEAVRQMLLQRAGFVRRLSDSDEEDPAAQQRRQQQAAGSGGGGGASGSAAAGRPPRPAPRGAAVAPAAAALWEEESEASEDTGIDGDAFMQQQFAAARAAAIDTGHSGGGGTGAAAAGTDGDVDGAAAAAQEQREQRGPAAAAAAAGGMARKAAEGAAKPQPAEKPPPALPKFGARPVAVVVKRKAEGEAGPAKPAKQAAAAGGSDSDGSGGGGGGLLGIAGYGSSGSDSP